MLKALYDYALSHGLSLPDGYVKKTVAAYIMFSSASPDFVEVWVNDAQAVPCPDVGSLANGKDKCNIIVEKRSIVIPEENTTKSRFFRHSLEQFGEIEADAKLCSEKLAEPDTLQVIREKLDLCKIKPSDRVSFMVDSRKLLDSQALQAWWQSWRQEILPAPKRALVPCLITGELTLPMTTTPPISGLQVVGGHARGDALICFDKPAFCSYGYKQAENAPVSETAMGAVKTALDALLKDAPVLSGMKFVHWYDQDVAPKCDPLFDGNFFGFSVNEEEEPGVDDAPEEIALRAQRAADTLIRSVEAGESPVSLDNSYHILLLTGVGGRVMVRRYLRGRYEELRENLTQWNQDLQLINPSGTASCKPLKLKGRLIRLLKYQKGDKRVFERLDKELSGITPAVLTAILGGTRLPDAVAVRALAHIRSKLLASDDGGGKNYNNDLDGWAYQWLKVWLLRHQERRDDMLTEEYNWGHTEPAYHCGAAMAIYGAIQNAAMPNVNTTVVQRYYASCVQSPALVLGRLSQISVHHLEKIKFASYFENLLEQVHTAIGSEIPATLNLEKQSYFALGYYQMSARLHREKLERIQAAQEKKAEEEV